MINMQRVYEELKEEEGLRLKAYKCSAGFVTVGIGHNCESGLTKPIIGIEITKVGQRITEEQALQLFRHDIGLVIEQLDKYLSWWRSLDDVRQYVMLSLCFNMGIGTLLKFKNTLKFMENRMFQHAALNLKKSLWFEQVKTRGVKLVGLVETGRFS